MELLDLPTEMLGKIMVTIVTVHGLDHAMLTRLVCKTFDTEILRAVNTTKALDQPDAGTRYCGERLLTGYLVSRTLNDVYRTQFSSQIFGETIDFIIDSQPRDEVLRCKYVSSLCNAVVQNYNFQSPGHYMGRVRSMFYDFLNPQYRKVKVKNCYHFSKSQVFSLTERALAACTRLQIEPVFRRHIMQGVEITDSCFGNSLDLAAERGDHEMAMSILSAEKNKAKASQTWVRAIQSAARGGKLILIESLLDPVHRIGAPEQSDMERAYCSWIRAAAASDHSDIIQYLLQRARSEGFLEGRPRAAQFLDHIEKLPPYDYIEIVVLWAAALNGHEDIARMALTNGAQVNADRYYQ